MCGIVGAFNFSGNSFEITEPYIVRMRDVMLHRGPDGAGVWIDEQKRAGLGHRRLSIIDLSTAAAQPMNSIDGRYWITFNGEIYNHRELRTELSVTDNQKWKTDHSDTEVILRAFQKWGIDCLQFLRGMFAFAIWDTKESCLWLARDRLGIKPLYYSIHNGRITFASEIKALLEDREQKRAVNETAFYHYLSFLTTPAPDTLFDGIKKLPPATWLQISSSGSVRQERYWDVFSNRIDLTGSSESDIADLILSTLREVITLHKVSDVPVGVFLSGGLDSSSNAILFSENEKKAVHTFSIGYQGNNPSYKDECEYARLIAGRIGSDHKEKFLDSSDLIDFLPKMIWHQDEPIADPVCVPVYYVSRLAKENNVIVSQVGEGADELFCGYPGWLTMLRLQKWNSLPVPLILKKTGLRALRMLGKERRTWYELLRRAVHHQPIFWGGAEAFSESHKQKLLSPRLQRNFKEFSSWDAISSIWDRFNRSGGEHSVLNWMSYLDLNLRLPELLLMRVDKMSMATGLEGRVPFMDHKFVELAMSIPSDLKIKNNNLKHILKLSVKNIVPEQIVNRPKQGFGIPMQEWFEQSLGSHMRNELLQFCKETDFINSNEVLRLMEAKRGPQLWYLANFAMWWRRFVAV